MEEQVDLTQGQRLYLQFILDTFRAESQWPTHDRLDQFLYQTDPDMDIEDIWKSLSPGLTSYLDMNLLNNSASLTLKGIYALEPEAPEFVLFLQVLNLCVQTHASAQTIRSDDILGSHPDWDGFSLEKGTSGNLLAGLVLRRVGHVRSSGKSDAFLMSEQWMPTGRSVTLFGPGVLSHRLQEVFL